MKDSFFTDAKNEDIPLVVNVHVEAFPGFFLTMLGPVFLRTMYKAFLSNPGALFIVAKNSNDVIGFAVGVFGGKMKDRSLALKYMPSFLFSCVGGMLRHPVKIGLRIVSRFLAVGEQPNIPPDASVLRSIGVPHRVRGSGVSSDLLREFEQQSLIRGARFVALTTDAFENGRAIGFYKKNGYEVSQEFFQDKKRKMLLMIKPLCAE